MFLNIMLTKKLLSSDTKSGAKSTKKTTSNQNDPSKCTSENSQM